MVKIFCDSSTKEACIVPEGRNPIVIPYPVTVTNNEGEYKAVCHALNWAKAMELREVELLTDSLLVVNQVSGQWKCRKEHLLPYRDRIRDLVHQEGWKVRYNWIPREENLAGKVLEP